VHWSQWACRSVIDLARRDEKYLIRDGLSTLKRVSVNSVNSIHNMWMSCPFWHLKTQFGALPEISIFRTPETHSLSSTTTTTSSCTTPTPSYTMYKRVRKCHSNGCRTTTITNRCRWVQLTHHHLPRVNTTPVSYLLDTRLKEGEGKEGVGSRKKGRRRKIEEGKER